MWLLGKVPGGTLEQHFGVGRGILFPFPLHPQQLAGFPDPVLPLLPPHLAEFATAPEREASASSLHRGGKTLLWGQEEQGCGCPCAVFADEVWPL